MKYELWKRVAGNWQLVQEIESDSDVHMIGNLYRLSPVAVAQLISYPGRRPAYIVSGAIKILKKAT